MKPKCFLNFRQLQVFIAVAELGSFTKAAKQLFLTQPAISWQVKTLETELGLVLLERADRSVSLTEAGEIFYRDAKRLHNLYEKMLSEMEEYRGLGTGKLRLGGSTIPGEYLLPNYIGRFKQTYPEIGVNLVIGDTGTIVEKLLIDEIQLGVIGAKVQEGKLELVPFLQDELILIAAPDHPWAKEKQVTLKDLSEGIYISREEDSGTKMVIEEKLAEKGIVMEKFKTAIELGSPRAVLTAVAAGLGLAWVSRWTAEESLRLGLVQEISVENFKVERNFYLATRPNRHLSPLTKAFMDFLLKK